MYGVTEIATLESIEVLTNSVNIVDNISSPQEEEQMQDVLQKLLERVGPGLTSHERLTFFHLLDSYADIFAVAAGHY